MPPEDVYKKITEADWKPSEGWQELLPEEKEGVVEDFKEDE